MKNTLQLLAGTSLLSLALGLAACGDDSSGDGSTTDASTTNGGTATDPSATSMNTTVSAESDSGPATTEATSATTDDPPTDSGEEVCGGAEPLENGGACAMDCGCTSEQCFVVGPLGGVCSDCNEDADCADTTGFGCNFGNPLTGDPAVCSADGGLGEGCETTDACGEGLLCSTLIDVPGILSASTCGECQTDADCTDQLCVPTYDIAAIAGNFNCVDAGTIADNEGCNLTGDGSECVSGNCAPAAIMGIPVVGVCSPCNEDSDCDGGTCMLPEVTLDGTSLGLAPGACV